VITGCPDDIAFVTVMVWLVLLLCPLLPVTVNFAVKLLALL
jgi:hypothetical protein